MSDAWAGYREERRRRRGGWAWNGRFAVIAAMLMVAAALFGVTTCWPQNPFGNRPAGAGTSDNPADAALVVYNESDPLSRDLADFYAEKRGIGHERVVGLKCPGAEEISRQEYDETIAGPLRAIFDARGWWSRSRDKPEAEPSSTVTGNRIRFLVLIRGIPLRIKPASNYAGDFSNLPAPIRDQNAASVDAELAALGLFTRSISGIVPNPYYRSYVRYNDTTHPGVMFTGRLDGPTGGMVKRMIENSLAVEKTGLWGRCYVDGRGLPHGGPDPHAEGDVWLTKLGTAISPRFLPTVSDNREAMYSAAFPMTEAAAYFGWYSEQPAGPFTREDFRFQPGAVACHIHSFSATSVRDPFKWWVGPLINRGADAVLGNVYEPYLTLTAHLDIFADRLFDGYTLAESAWEATPGLSWMNTVVGDPLYRPGKYWKDQQFDLDASDAPAAGEPAMATEGKAYLQGARLWQRKGAAAGAPALEKSGARLRSGRIFEGLAALYAAGGDVPHAVTAFEKAGQFYKSPDDRARVCWGESQLLAHAGQKARAASVLEAGRKQLSGTAAVTVLDELAAALASDKP